MNCTHIREELVEVASGSPATPEIEAHVRSCSGCAETLQHLKETMSMMDEWVAPEPSPYFDTRLQARLREEQGKSRSGIIEWLRRPALALVATALLVTSVVLFQGGRDLNTSSSANGQQHNAQVVAQKGTAVGDLRFLDENSEVLSDFEALDALDATAAEESSATY